MKGMSVLMLICIANEHWLSWSEQEESSEDQFPMDLSRRGSDTSVT